MQAGQHLPGSAPGRPFLIRRQFHLLQHFSRQLIDEQRQRTFISDGEKPWRRVAKGRRPLLVAVDLLLPNIILLVDLEIAMA